MMQGIHVSLLGGIAFIALAYWIIGHSQAAFTLGPGAATQFGKVARTLQQGPGTG